MESGGKIAIITKGFLLSAKLDKFNQKTTQI